MRLHQMRCQKTSCSDRSQCQMKRSNPTSHHRVDQPITMRIAAQHKTPAQVTVSKTPSAMIDIGQTSDLRLDCTAYSMNLSASAVDVSRVTLILGSRLYA